MGENPLNISYLWNKMYVSLMKSAAGLQYCSKGPLYQAVSGVDIALWDILGKRLNTPVYQLLGGVVCKEIKAYANGLGPEDYKDMVEDSINQGFNAFKIKVGFGKELDKWNLKNIRSMIGDNCLLMADALIRLFFREKPMKPIFLLI